MGSNTNFDLVGPAVVVVGTDITGTECRFEWQHGHWSIYRMVDGTMTYCGEVTEHTPIHQSNLLREIMLHARDSIPQGVQ